MLKYDPLTKCVDLEMSNSGKGIYYLYGFLVDISNIVSCIYVSIINTLHCIVFLLIYLCNCIVLILRVVFT